MPRRAAADEETLLRVYRENLDSVFAFDRVWELAEKRVLSLRSAALVCGIREVAAALDVRGLYP